jgi:hypothetical protein
MKRGGRSSRLIKFVGGEKCALAVISEKGFFGI